MRNKLVIQHALDPVRLSDLRYNSLPLTPLTKNELAVTNADLFTKIIIRNVGVLKAFDTPNAPQLSKLTLFYGRNGRGKSTLTAVLRAARDGCSNTVLGRKALGNGAAAPEVILIKDASNIRFGNGAWIPRSAPIEVFDTTFIADNIYAGESTELAHDRGLFSIIIGRDGVRLAKHLDRFNALAKAAGAAIKENAKALSADIPTGMPLDEFLALSPNLENAARLEAAERSVRAVKEADKVAALKPLEAISVSALPEKMSEVLVSTAEAVDASARQRLLEHFARFNFQGTAEAWIGYGIEHIYDDACPFCGRDDVDAEGMVTIYGQIFGETYKAHLARIKELAANVEIALGDVKF